MIPPAIISIILRYVLPGLGVLVLLFGCYEWARERGVRSRDDEVAQLNSSITTLKDNSATLQHSLDEQNMAIEAQRLASEKTIQAGQTNLAAANKLIASRNATIDQMQKAVTKPHAAGENCVEETTAGRKL